MDNQKEKKELEEIEQEKTKIEFPWTILIVAGVILVLMIVCIIVIACLGGFNG